VDANDPVPVRVDPHRDVRLCYYREARLMTSEFYNLQDLAIVVRALAKALGIQEHNELLNDLIGEGKEDPNA
jgi:hypothetical protein